MDTSKTLAGADLLSCDLDAACPTLDCDTLVLEYQQAFQAAPEAAEVVAYFCGLSYVEKLNAEKPPD